MLKRLFGVLIMITFLIFTTRAYAETNDILGCMMKKLGRGIINALTGWVEFPAQIGKGYYEGFRGDRDNKLLGVIVGTFDGIGHSAGRTLSGVADIVGFWAAGPKDNEKIGIPLDGEYPWEEGEPHDMFNPNFAEAAITPIVNKFLRGVSDVTLGFMELPGQILKGISEGNAGFSIIKGLYYWSGREISGVSDIATALFACPDDTVGVTFDEDRPWDAFTKAMQEN